MQCSKEATGTSTGSVHSGKGSEGLGSRVSLLVEEAASF